MAQKRFEKMINSYLDHDKNDKNKFYHVDLKSIKCHINLFKRKCNWSSFTIYI